MEHNPEPSPKQILAEAERRRAAQASPTRPLSDRERRLILTADRFALWLCRHWLAVFNLAAFVYVGVPFLAPVLMHVGLQQPALFIYGLYRPLCHQLPFRSWYLFGSRLAYSIEELSRLAGAEALVEHGYIGDPSLGYKVALCQRDTAIYGTILLAGLSYSLVRRRLRALPLWAYVAFGLVPIGLDGGLQFLSYAAPLVLPSLAIPRLESTPLRRVITGALFGLATVWLAYPHLQEACSELQTTLEKRLGATRSDQ